MNKGPRFKFCSRAFPSRRGSPRVWKWDTREIRGTRRAVYWPSPPRLEINAAITASERSLRLPSMADSFALSQCSCTDYEGSIAVAPSMRGVNAGGSFLSDSLSRCGCSRWPSPPPHLQMLETVGSAFHCRMAHVAKMGLLPAPNERFWASAGIFHRSRAAYIAHGIFENRGCTPTWRSAASCPVPVDHDIRIGIPQLVMHAL